MEDVLDHYVNREGAKEDTAFILGELNQVYESIKKVRDTKLTLGDASGFRATVNAAKDAAKAIEELTKAEDRLTRAQESSEKAAQAKLKTQLLQTKADAEVVKQIEAEEKAEQASIKTKKLKTAEIARQIKEQKKLNSTQTEIVPGDLGSIKDTTAAISDQSDTLNDYNRAQAEAANANVAFGGYQRNVKDAVAETEESISRTSLAYDKYTGHLEDNLSVIAQNNVALKSNKASQREINTAIAESGRVTEKQISKLTALRQEEIFLTAENKKLSAITELQVKEFNSVTGSIEKARAQVQLLTLSYAELSATEKASPFGVGLKADLKETTKGLQGLEKQADVTGKRSSGVLGKAFGGLRQIAQILPGIGIAGLLAFAIDPIVAFITKVKELTGNAKILDDLFKDASKSASEEISKLDILKTKLNDTNISRKERIIIAKEYNKVAEETNKINLNEIDNLGLLNIQIEKQIGLVKQQALAKAAQAQIAIQAQKLLEAEFKFSQAIETAGLSESDVRASIAQGVKESSKIRDNINTSLDGFNKKVFINKNFDTQLQGVKRVGKELEVLLTRKESEAFQLDRVIKLLLPSITTDGLKTKDKEEKNTKAQNVKDNTAEEILKAQFEVNKARLQNELDTNKAIVENELSTFQERLNAQQKFSEATLELIELERKFAIDSEGLKLKSLNESLEKQKKEKGANVSKINEQQEKEKVASVERLKAIDAKFDTDRLSAAIKISNDFSKIFDEEFEKTKKRQKEELESFRKLQEYKRKLVADKIDLKSNEDELTENANYEIALAKSTADNKEKIERKHQKVIADIKDTARLSQLINEERTLDAQRKLLVAFGFDTASVDKLISDNQLAQSNIRIGITKREQAEKDKIRDEALDKVLLYEKEATDLIATIVNAQNTKQKNAIQDEIDLNEKKKNEKIDAVNKELISDEAKAAKIKIIESSAQANRERLELRQRKLDQERARFEKNLGIMQILLQIGIALAKQQYQAAALAGVALIKAIATPIPKFGLGKSKSNKYSGLAEVDEAGKTEIIYRAKTKSLEMAKGAPKSRLTFLDRDDIVWPSADAMLASTSMSRLNPIKDNVVEKDNGMRLLADAVNNLEITTQLITKTGWKKQNMKIAEYADWVNKNIRN